MKKEKDEITDLFRTRLADAGMAVRDGFWEELSQDIPVACQHRRRLMLLPCGSGGIRVAGVGCVLGYVLVSSPQRRRWRRRLPKSWLCTQRRNFGWRWGTCQSIADGNGTCIAETGT